jgi:hypothetical protein
MQEFWQDTTSTERLPTTTGPVCIGVQYLEATTHEGVLVVDCNALEQGTVLVVDQDANAIDVYTLKLITTWVLYDFHVI